MRICVAHLSSCLVFYRNSKLSRFFPTTINLLTTVALRVCVCVCARLHLILSVSQVNCEYHFIRPVGFCVTLVLPLKIIFSNFFPLFY